MIKIKEWGRRYIPAEILAIIGALCGGLAMNYFFQNPVITALGGTWGENVGYYGQIVTKDIKERMKKDKKISILGVLKVIRNGIVEFGVAEYLDSFIIRPFAMYLFPRLVDNLALGLIIGKFSADITFYIPTIFFYEFRKKHLKD